jgi:hypothetical protein
MASNCGIPGIVAMLIPLVLSACGSTPTSPSQQGPLRLDAQITQTRLAPDDTATVTFTLRNVSSETITLRFSSSCQILPYVTDRRTQQIVHPGGGGWVCATVVTGLTLAPGESSTQQIQLRAANAATYPFVALPPGAYETYAEIDAYRDNSRFSLRSTSVQFSSQ